MSLKKIEFIYKVKSFCDTKMHIRMTMLAIMEARQEAKQCSQRRKARTMKNIDLKRFQSH